MQATRSGRLLQNEPIRVEVIRREAIERLRERISELEAAQP